jgi:hypothetical protein
MQQDQQPTQPCASPTCACSQAAAACGCSAQSASPLVSSMANAPAPKLKWWLEHSQRQTAKLWELLDEYLDEAIQSAILEQLGRNCALSYGAAQRYVGDPEGFFNLMAEHSGETIRYDREAGIITVITRERDCDCLLVNSGHISPVYCNCSLGWQKQTYEIILGKKVDVKILESVVRGSRRCVFHITVLKEDTDA